MKGGGGSSAAALTLLAFARSAWAQATSRHADPLCHAVATRQDSPRGGGDTMASRVVCRRGPPSRRALRRGRLSGTPRAHQRRVVSNRSESERAVRHVSTRAVPGRSRDGRGATGPHAGGTCRRIRSSSADAIPACSTPQTTGLGSRARRRAACIASASLAFMTASSTSPRSKKRRCPKCDLGQVRDDPKT